MQEISHYSVRSIDSGQTIVVVPPRCLAKVKSNACCCSPVTIGHAGIEQWQGRAQVLYKCVECNNRLQVVESHYLTIFLSS